MGTKHIFASLTPNDFFPSPDDLVRSDLFVPLQNYIFSIIIPLPPSKGERSALNKDIDRNQDGNFPSSEILSPFEGGWGMNFNSGDIAF